MAEQRLDKQRPIAATLKTRKKLWREAENPVRWAYAKLQRERDKTRRVYPVNPYAEVYQFRDNLYGIYTESLDGMGDPWMFLIVGPEKALLIDTAFGVGNLKALVEQIVGDMPLLVVNTHAHVDHCYGNFWFDTVYCHEYEVPRLQKAMNPHIWDYLFDAQGQPIWCEFDRADLAPFRPYQIVGCPDGYIFDLGQGYEVELVHLGGHTPGHAGLLDKRNGIFFGGDDTCVGALGIGRPEAVDTHPQWATVEGMCQCLERLAARSGEFESVFPSHGPVDLGSIVIDSILEACHAVLADPAAYDAVIEREFDGHKVVNYGKLIYLSGYLTYNKTNVYMNPAERA